MGDKITLLPPADTSPHPEVLSGFDLILDARRGVGKAKTAETDPMLAFAEASFLIEELNGYAGVRRDQTTEFKDGDKTVKSTVGERVARLPEQINRQFKRAEEMADGADFIGGVLPSGSLTFAAGETGKTISLPVSGDTAVEPDANAPFAVKLAGMEPPAFPDRVSKVSAIVV